MPGFGELSEALLPVYSLRWERLREFTACGFYLVTKENGFILEVRLNTDHSRPIRGLGSKQYQRNAAVMAALVFCAFVMPHRFR